MTKLNKNGQVGKPWGTPLEKINPDDNTLYVRTESQYKANIHL